MCLAVPAKITELDGEFAKADFGGVSRRINIQMTPGIKVGEYCLVHAGFSVETITEEYAKEAEGYIAGMFEPPPDRGPVSE